MRHLFLKLVVSTALLVGAKVGLAAGLMSPVNGGAELELTEQQVEVVIQNGFTVTEVTQVFSNPHARDLEALYRFPVPHRASVGEFTYWIDEQPVHAEVFKKQEARDRYAKEVSNGRESALVEKEEYKHFDMRVSPVRANESVKVRLVYLQEASIDHGMGRYAYPLEEAELDANTESFWTRNESVQAKFSFRLHLRSAYPVDAIRVPYGQASVQQLDSGEWQVSIASVAGHGAQMGQNLSDTDLAQREALETAANGNDTLTYEQSPGRSTNVNNQAAFQLNKDLIVYWRLAENLPGAMDLVTYKEAGAADGTFMLTLTPGIDLAPITEGRDWIFVLDSSGSMAGDYATLVAGVEQSLAALNANDRYAVVTFSNSTRMMTNRFEQATANNVSDTVRKLKQHGTGGGTDLYKGLEKGLRLIDRDRTTSILLVTDGVANVGTTEAKSFLELLNKVDLRVFTAVMGNSANKPLLSAITHHTSGFAMNVSTVDDVNGLMLQMLSKATHEALHDVSIRIDGVAVSELSPHEFSRVYRGEQLNVLGKYSGSGLAQVTLKAKVSGEKKTYQAKAAFPPEDTAHPELERLWAYSTIEALKAVQDLVGESEDSQNQITDIALDAGIVTDYTSLLVLRDDVFESTGIARNNATRVERERMAREVRAQQAIQPTRQDTQQPMFNAPRHSTSNGGGSLGWFLLALLAALSCVRVTLEVRERRQAKHAPSTETRVDSGNA